MSVIDPKDRDHGEVLRRLRDERIIWLVTVDPEGQPQPVPVWFLWEDGSFLMYSQPDRPKLRNIAANPRVALHLLGTETGGDIAIFEGTAAPATDVPPADRVPAYIDRYRDLIDGYGWTPASFAEDYSRPVRITPTVLRIW